MGADVSELRAWEAALERAATEAPKEGEKVVGRGCSNVKKDVRRRWSGMAHLPHLPWAVTYDVTGGDIITGEVGAERSRPQGKLAWVAEYGTPTSAPHPAMSPALDAEEPRFIRAVADLGERLLT